jgi:carbamoyl-phosphate synthase (ammonia)
MVAADRPEAFIGSTFGSTSAMFYRQGTLVLEDGTRLRGVSFGYEGSVSGELVFTTGMVGYPESLTDPSYRGQLLVMTYPIVGNYGVPEDGNDELGLPKFFESDRVQVAALIVADYSHHHSHWNSQRSLSQWLTQQKVPALYGLDTRLLTKKIREKGALRARIEFEEAVAVARPEAELFVDINSRNLVAEVSVTEPVVYGKGNTHKVLALDCGIKANIIRSLVQRDCEMTLLPWNAPLIDKIADYDGLFLSNGPGDPAMVQETIANLRAVLEGMDDGSIPTKPIFGICLGNQMLGLAAGATTYKLPFGNRGQNQPVLNLLNNKCVITPQNHGFALDAEKLPAGWSPLFVNRNDGSNEGIMHESKPWFTAQFHPEAKCGPSDTSILFDQFVNAMDDPTVSVRDRLGEGKYEAPEELPLTKVLLLGSGGLSIGQAGEFDYSGAQAIKALKEEGLSVVLINPNIASVQTNVDGQGQTAPDKVYLLPVTPEYVEQVIEREKPEGIILSMGGQTGLNCGIELEKRGILEKYGVRVLGTSVASIEATEDRGIFSDKLNEIDERIAPSFAVNTVEDALAAAEKIGYPCMTRSAFALGGLGSGIMPDKAALEALAREALASSPQILIEKSLKGWKEVEYEVVRDAADNCITVCNMENFDPLGVHTGDSIVIAPSQTLSDEEYHMLRTTAIKVVRHLGIVGECNIQYALDPTSQDYCIIEVNPRLSRSSALASKATGYPLAFVAAKLALGKLLPDLKNSVTRSTTACFEPSLDYIVVKIPRWDLSKFDRVSREIGSAMKSVGEVMAIGRTFEESLQKAMRMTDTAVGGFEPSGAEVESDEELEGFLTRASDRRIFYIALAFEKGWSVDRIHSLTAIDPWFLWKLKRVSNMYTILREYSESSLPATTLLQAKKSGFSDKQIGAYVGSDETSIRAIRKGFGILPFVKQIDTTAAETPAATNYLYMTYNGNEHDVVFDEPGTMVLGSGVYRIGSSVEFDWCSVSAIRTLRKMGQKAVMVNYNPETVSTDYDECDRLYFEELSLERVLDVYEAEVCARAIVSVGGQIPNTLALQMGEADMNIAGTSPTMIDTAEDRNKFSDMCDRVGIDQPEWRMLTSTEDALTFCEDVGYPCLVRPSYVLSGAAMNVAYSADELTSYLGDAAEVSGDKPVVVSKFIENGREIDVDAVAQKGKVLVFTISEHVENAGVHSGDATLMLPPQTIDPAAITEIERITHLMAESLEITGPFNMQLIAKEGTVKVIECNLRASRSFPFSSKCLGVNFIQTATTAMCTDEPLEALERTTPEKDFVGVKAPMFSFQRLKGADPSLGVEMSSTGEVACFGADRYDAFLKAILSTGMKLPRSNILVSIQDRLRNEEVLPALKTLAELGYKLFATVKTADFLTSNGVPVTMLEYPAAEGDEPIADSIDDYISRGDLHLVLMFSNQYSQRILQNYAIRRLAVDYGVPLITNLQVATMFAESLKRAGATATGEVANTNVVLDPRSLHEWYE